MKNFYLLKRKILFLNFFNDFFVIILTILNCFLFYYLLFFFLSFFKFSIIIHILIFVSIYFLLKLIINKKNLFNKNDIFIFLDNKYSPKKGIIYTAFTLNDSQNLYSNILINELNNKSFQILNKNKINELIKNIWLFRCSLFSFILFLAISSFCIFKFPDKFILFFNSLYSSQKNYFARTYFYLQPKNLSVYINDDLKIHIKKIGKLDDLPINLHLFYSNNQEKIISLSSKDNINFEYEFFNITEPINFKISNYSNEFFSQNYKIDVIIKPIIKIEALTVYFPDYTKKETEKYFTDKGNIKVLQHSRITIDGSTNFIITNASAKINNTIIKKINFSGNTFSFQFFANNSFTYSLTCADTKYNVSTLTYKIEVFKDEFPEIEIIEPDKYFKVSEEMIVPLNILVSDDFGIDTIGIYYVIDNEYINKFYMPFTFNENIGKFNALYLWDLEKINSVAPGSKISYFAFTYDNDFFNKNKFVRSDTFYISVPSLTDLFAENFENDNASNQIINNLNAKQSDLARETKKIIENIMRKEQNDWQIQQELKTLYDKQQEIKNSLENIKKSIEKSIQNFQPNNLIDQSILQKVNEIKKLFDELIDDELKNQLSNIQSAMQQVKLSEKEKMLMKNKFDMEKFQKKLDTTLNILQKFNTLKKLNIMKNLYKELSKRQNEISNDIINMNDKNKISAKQEQITKDLENLNNLIEQFKESNKDIEKLLEKIKNEELINKSKNLTKNIRGKNKSDNLTDSQKLTKDLLNHYNLLNDLIEKDERAKIEEAQKIILSIIYELLFLNNSLEQEKKDIIKLVLEDLLLQLNKSFQKLIEEYKKIFKLTLFSDFKILKLFYSFNDKINLFEDKLKNKLSINRNYELENLQTELLKLVKILFNENKELLNRFNKAANEDYADDMNELSKLQSLLNSLTESFDFGNADEDMLKQLAFEQQLLREMLERIEEKQKEFNLTFGRLEDVINKMKEVEEKIAKYKAQKSEKKEIVEKQKEIVKRMLQAQKAINKEQEKEEKREAEKAKEYTIDQKFITEKLKKYENYLNQEKIIEESIPKIYIRYIKEIMKK